MQEKLIYNGDCPISALIAALAPEQRRLLAVELSVIQTARDELHEAQKRYPPMNSPHEGWALIREELDELWDEVRVKDSQRDAGRMRKEAVQVAAMAIRFILDVCEVSTSG